MNALYWLIALLVFSLLIFFHELGHYLTARMFGVKINEFSIGMGPKMLTYTSQKTGIKYSLGVFLIGGYVSMAGEDEESEDPNAISRKPAWQRFIVVAAGAVMNLLLGFVLIFSMVLSLPVLTGTTVAAHYESDKLPFSSADYGLRAGDTIVAVNGTRVHIGYDLMYLCVAESLRYLRPSRTNGR